jgi:hypothetical protein
MPLRLPLVELAGFVRRGGATAARALVDADVLPWRPTRGIYLLIERGTPAPPDALLDVPGVAGVWSFEGTDSLHERLAATDDLRLTVAYLDGDPPDVAARLPEVLAPRWASGATSPLLAAPFVTVVPWRWDAALPG